MKKIIITAIGKDSPGLVNKITSIIMNQQDSAHNMSFGGHIDLYVQESSMKESIELLEKHGNERNS